MKLIDSELYGLDSLHDITARHEIEKICVRKNGCFELIPKVWCRDHISRLLASNHYLSLREASGEPMPYKVVREGDNVRFE